MTTEGTLGIAELVGRLEAVGVRLWEDGGQIRFRAPQGALTDEHKAALRHSKAALLDYLRDDATAGRLVPAPANLHQPFPLTDVQSAYLLGRNTGLDYGGVGCQVYLEAAWPGLDPDRLGTAWNSLIARHPMLRAVVEERGFQRILDRVPEYVVAVTDGTTTVRGEMCALSYEPGSWPMFDVRMSGSGDGTVLHLSFDLLIADFMSIQLLLDELHHLYSAPDPLPELDISFRDYTVAARRRKDRRDYQRARDYWWRRIDELPSAPALPTLDAPSARGDAPFHRWRTELDSAQWARFGEQAAARGLTASGAVLAAYAATIGRWTRQERFTLNVTLLDRLPVHRDVEALVGDFTTVDLLAVTQDPGEPFAVRARAVQAQLWEDMDHRGCSGIEVLRELGNRRGRPAALMPIVFTSAIGLNDDRSRPGFWRDATLLHGLTKTPQVWIDCQALVQGDALAINWDVREGVFAPGTVDDMFAAFERLVRELATDDSAWDRPAALPLPAAQAARRREANDTATAPVPDRLLHDAIVEHATKDPGRIAVLHDGEPLSYGDLLANASAVSAALARAETRPGERIGVVMERGPEQVTGVLGVLLTGAAYVPIDVTQPADRRNGMLADAGVRTVLTQARLLGEAVWPAGVTPIAVDDLPEPGPYRRAPDSPGSVAYVIYTSGSTGAPKGVRITHRNALNTIEDINRRFAVTGDDRVLGLAGLGFDLSVYDMFGPLAVGGCLVLPEHRRRADPSHWAELVAEHGVTLWNSVPAQMQMLVDYLTTAPRTDTGSLRLAMLSGDWIPVNLPDRIRRLVPGIELAGLGGATEAAIWSICHPIGVVEPHWRSIPYGRPLTNQSCHVLDPWSRDCPDGVTGEIHIGGAGVASGYLGEPERTEKRFFPHPRTGEPLYRTGDLGRYLPNGEIEFLGREDDQVKIRGHRIELAEVEAAIVTNPGVAGAAVIAAGDTTFDRHLVAFVETARRTGPVRDELAATLTGTAEDAGGRVLSGVDKVGYVRYLRRLDEVALSCMLAAFRSAGLFAGPDAAHGLEEILAATGAIPRHHRAVRRWLRALCDNGFLTSDANGRYAGAPPADPAVVEAGWREVDAMLTVFDPASTKVHDYFKASTGKLAELLRGEGTGAVQLLFPEGRSEITESLYNVTLFNRWANQILAACVRSIATAHTGTLRVLEVGAGVGGTSRDVIPALAGHDVDYLFTDLSQFFLNHAKETFRDHPWVRYATLDINTGYREQGLSPNSFDVVILGDVLHATRHVGRTIAALRELLAPGGWLLFAEMTRDHYQIMTSMELLLIDETTTGEFEDMRHGKDQTFVADHDWVRLLAEPGDELVFSLPHQDDVLADIGLRVYASRVKTDRVRVEPRELLATAATRLPPSMMPSSIQIVDRLPLTANAKVDRDRLETLVPRSRDSLTPQGDLPTDELERRIAGLWAEVLALPQVGRASGFFELGGDSLLASQVTGLMQAKLPEASTLEFAALLRSMLEGPTVMALAAELRPSP